MLYEFCAENLTDIPAALCAGAGRIELCDNLARGGTTPSAGVIEQAVALVHRHPPATVRVIIRPRAGDFVYDERELRAMETDIRYAGAQGVDGVVIGCLKVGRCGYELDRAGMERLAGIARGVGEIRGRDMGITFHMAFDALGQEARLKTIDALAELGVDRILTHGGAAGTPIEGNFETLRSCIEHADGRLTIVPGGGVTHENAARVAAALGADELHGTRIVDLA